MDYRTLGRSGCAVSSLCLGTMTFGVETDEPGAHQQLDRFLEVGGTFVDTADVYGDGRSEEIIGRWFASRPAEVTEPVVLATKGRFPRGSDDSPNGAGLSARQLTRALDGSLRRLGLESVDLYQVHAYDPLTPLEETLRTLDQFIRAGKIRYYGLSNFTGWQLTKAVWLARVMNVAEPVTLQPQYSLLAREIEWEIVPACRGARSAGAGCPANTGGTSARPGTPGSAMTRTAAWRPTTGAAPSAPGTSSTRSRRWPRTAACPWPRLRWPG
jgi:aryl-alcohol dehydrogenase-like predicted oxidoreductase